MNLERENAKPAAAVWRGLLAAEPGAPPDLDIADALAENPDVCARIVGQMKIRQNDYQLAMARSQKATP